MHIEIEDQTDKINELNLIQKRLQKENKVYRDYIIGEKLEYDFNQIEAMIKESEKEQIDLSQFEVADRELQLKLQLRRKTIDRNNQGTVAQVSNFFEKNL